MKPLRSPLFDFPDNEIPAALANVLSRLLGLPVNRSFVQLNSVGHTGADGFKRLANQALFAGAAVQGATCLIVDDFVGQGGTLANLIGFIRSQGSEVLGASVLTGKPYSAKLAPDEAQINALKHKHGRELETWWAEKFGFGFGFGEVAFDPPTSKSSNGATPQYRT